MALAMVLFTMENRRSSIGLKSLMFTD